MIHLVIYNYNKKIKKPVVAYRPHKLNDDDCNESRKTIFAVVVGTSVVAGVCPAFIAFSAEINM
jgi:hypothetical protein